MKYIETPLGDVFKYDECVIFEEDDSYDIELSIDTQEELAKDLFEQTGILIAYGKGGEK